MPSLHKLRNTIMRTLTLHLSIATVLLLTGLAGACGGKLDHDDPESVAKAALIAFKSKSIDGVVELVPAAEQKETKRRIARSGFKGWRVDAVDGWGGDLGEIKLKGQSARVAFTEFEGRVAVVVLNKLEGKWYFEDISGPSKERWERWGD